jgi:hypothetical protein
LEKTKDPQAVEGRKVCLTNEEVSALVKIVRKLGAHLVKEFGEPATETLTAVALPAQSVASATLPRGPLTGVKMSLDAQRLAVFLSERAQSGIEIHDAVEAATVMEKMKLTQEDFEIAADEIEERGWAKLHLGGIRIAPTARLFFETDGQLRGWDPMMDAKSLAIVLVGRGEEGTLQELDGQLGWGIRRINVAAQFLVIGGYAGTLRTNSDPYVYPFLMTTPKMKRFARES